MNSDTFFTTEQAAAQLSISRDALLNWLYRWPEYRPQVQMGRGSLVWTAAEIEAVRGARDATRKLAGRQPKKQEA